MKLKLAAALTLVAGIMSFNVNAQEAGTDLIMCVGLNEKDVCEKACTEKYGDGLLGYSVVGGDNATKACTEPGKNRTCKCHFKVN